LSASRVSAAHWLQASALLFTILLPRAEAGIERQRVVCPIDGAVTWCAVAVSRNRAGGLDSDGCLYSVEKERVFVHSEFEIVTCSGCYYSALAEDFQRPVKKPAATKVLVALGASAFTPPRGSDVRRLRVSRRYHLAVICYQALGGARRALGYGDDHELMASLYLRAAWFERGAAVALGVLEFRPQSLKAGVVAYERLGTRVRLARRSFDEELRQVDELLAQYESLRRALESSRSRERRADKRFADLGIELALMKLEVALFAFKSRVKGRSALGAASPIANEIQLIRVQQVQAALRLGFRASMLELIGRLRREGLESLAGQLASFAKRERALLRLALEELKQVDPSKTESGALRFLEVDLLRRIGSVAAARSRLLEISPKLRSSPRWRLRFRWLASVLEP